MVADLKHDLLVRAVAMEKAITGIQDAVPRLYDPAAATGPFPRFVNGLVRSTPKRDGAGYWREPVQALLRLIVGPWGSGYVGEREDQANSLYDTIFDYFAARTALQDPVTNAAFRYLDAAEAATLTDLVYARPLEFTPTVILLCADFTLNAVLWYPVSRVVGS